MHLNRTAPGVRRAGPRPDRGAAAADEAAVLPARLVPPATPPGMLARPRLTTALEMATLRPTTVVRAPAGSGRTVALAAWAAATSASWAWLTLCEADDDPDRLQAHLVESLAHARPGSPGPLVLVLEDVHRLRLPGTIRRLRRLLVAPPRGVHIVASGRGTPPAPGDGPTGVPVHVGPGELAFTEDEAAALLDGVVGLRLGAVCTAAAWRRTGGWATGLALVAEETPRDPGRERFAEALEAVDAAIAAQVEARVLAPADPDRRALLTRASVLDHPTDALCDAVLGTAATGVVGEARALGLLVPAAGDREAWRAPFGPALRRLLEPAEPGLAAALHARASAASESLGDAAAAIAHATEAGDPVRATALTDAYVAGIGGRPRAAVGRGERPSVPCPWRGPVAAAVEHRRGALAVLDDPACTVRATTAAVLGQALWLAGDDAGVRALLESSVGDVEHPAPRSWSLAVLALAVGPEDPERARRLARQARRIAGRPDGTWLEHVLAHQALADALRRTGDLEGARGALSRAAARTAGTVGTGHHALTLLLAAELALAAGDRAAAADAAGRADGHAEPSARPPAVARRLAAVGDALALRGARGPAGRGAPAIPTGD